MSSNTLNLISAENLVTGYKTGKNARTVTSSFTSSFGAGIIISIIGPNGCGKTTLIKTLSGMIRPLSGNILFGEERRDIARMGAKELAGKRSVVLSKPPDTAMLSVFDIVSFGRAPHTGWEGHLSETDMGSINDSLTLTGTIGLSERLFRRLSDGEKQKVMIARALAQDTPVIFFDEPSAFLDLPSRLELSECLCSIRKEKGKLLAITTHDLDFALKHSDQLLLIDSGGAIHQGTPEQLAGSGMIGKVFGRGKLYFNPQKREFEKTDS